MPKLVFSEDVEGADAHGAALTKHNSYLWVADRGRNLIWVVDTATDVVVNVINLAPWLTLSGKAPIVPTPEMLQNAGHCGHFSPDPTPDLLVLSPEGTHMFLTFRGPNPLSGDPHVSTGATPGVGVLKITAGGRAGWRVRSHRADEQPGRERGGTGRCSRHLGSKRKMARRWGLRSKQSVQPTAGPFRLTPPRLTRAIDGRCHRIGCVSL